MLLNVTWIVIGTPTKLFFHIKAELPFIILLTIESIYIINYPRIYRYFLHPFNRIKLHLLIMYIHKLNNIISTIIVLYILSTYVPKQNKKI